MSAAVPNYSSASARFMLLGVGLIIVLGPAVSEFLNGVQRGTDVASGSILILLALSQVAHIKGRHGSARVGAGMALAVTAFTLSSGLLELSGGGADLLKSEPLEWIGLTLLALSTTLMYTRGFGVTFHTVAGASLPNLVIGLSSFGMIASIAVPDALGVAPKTNFSFALIFLSMTLYMRAVRERALTLQGLRWASLSSLILSATGSCFAMFVAGNVLCAMVIALTGTFLYAYSRLGRPCVFHSTVRAITARAN